jgi:hypothetical protein
MGFTISFDGMDEYRDQLEGIEREIPKLVNSTLYEGAAILADAVQQEIDGLRQIPPEARQGLHDGLGVARFWRENGSTVTKIGWEGYNKKRTKRWPKGQPNAMIARSVQRGTSWMRADRFATRAAKKARQKCLGVMETHFDVELQKLTKNK